MIFREMDLRGAFLIDLEPAGDERGFFARTYCREEFEARGLRAIHAQSSISFNAARGTLRGLHYQLAPAEEAKLVRCTRGAIYDVLVDLRRGSPTFCRWAAVELSAENRRMVYAAEGMAHGFITLRDSTEVLYQISAPYRPELARGVRFDDPAFGIRWPLEPAVMSERDRSYPPFDPRAAGVAGRRDG